MDTHVEPVSASADEAPGGQKTRKTLVIVVGFCAALVLLVALNMK